LGWSFVFGAVSALAAAGTILFSVKSELKHMDQRKHNIIEKAMRKPPKILHTQYPELIVKDQVDMVKEFIFSNKASLVLIEGAQGVFS
jgi:hypothetical protein